MKSKFLLFWGITVILAYGCSGGTKESPCFYLENNFAETGIGIYSFAGIYDSVLVSYSYYDSLMCRVLVNTEDTVVLGESFLRKGKGPGEFLQPEFSVYEDSLFVLETMGRMRIDKAEFLTFSQGDTMESFPLDFINGPFNVSSFSYMGNGKFVCLVNNLQTEDILYEIDVPNHKAGILNYNIKDGFRGNPVIKALVYMNSGHVHFNTELSKIAYTCGEGLFFEILDYADGAITGRKTVLDKLPEYDSMEQNGMVSYKITKTGGFRGIKPRFTDKYIYAVYHNPNPEELYKGYPWYYNDRLEVFDWYGNHICSLETDRPFGPFIVSDQDDYLFTLSMDLDTKETLLLRYPLYSVIGSLLQYGL